MPPSTWSAGGDVDIKLVAVASQEYVTAMSRTVLVLLAVASAVFGSSHKYTEDSNKVLSNIVEKLRDSKSGQQTYDKVADDLLNEINQEVLTHNHSIVQLPKKTYSIDKIIVKGKVQLINGSVGNFATFKRTGPTNVEKSKDGKTYKMTVTVGLGSFLIQFQKYRAKLNGHVNEGNIAISVAKHSIQLQITLKLQGKGCSIKLNKIEIKNFGALNVRIVPDDVLLRKAVKYVVGHNQKELIDKFLNSALECAKKKLKNFKCKLDA